MKPFKIHLIFAVLFIVAVVALVETAGFLHSLPSREWEFWHLMLVVPVMILVYGTMFSWLLFFFYHLFVLSKKKDKPKDRV
jgi:uncharacterized BrkB/YihY/UPF0761 family membrane protein